MSLRALVVTPSPELREALEVRLADAGYETFCASEAGGAAGWIASLRPDLVLWGLLEETGRARLPGLRRLSPESYWAGLLAGPGADPEDPARALEAGLDDCLETTEGAAAELLLRRAARVSRERRQRRRLERELSEHLEERPIVGASSAMIDLLEALENAAGFPTAVLIQGERGTGKEGLARTLHAQSARRMAPFVRVGLRGDAAGVASALFGDGDPGLGSRLLDAGGGTIFLDDVDALDGESQRRLLRVLAAEEITLGEGSKPRRIDVRVVSATTRDLRASVGAGCFDEELHRRLAGVLLRVPALRDRGKDIPLLLDHFLEKACRRHDKALRGLSDEALERLVDYAWPGNVRELENVVERAVILARGDQVTLRELPDRLDATSADAEEDLGLRRGRKRLEAELIRRALRRTGGNRTRAARLLEISHRALLYKLKEYEIRD